MLIQQKEDGKGGEFFIEKDGEILAEMVYSWSGANVLVIEHTEVDERLEGKGIGKQLVHRGVEFAREKGSKIIPRCVFAKAIMQKTPEYQDVLN